MAQETTTAKRCETCGRLGACPSMRNGKLMNLTGMKMEDTPGFCYHWVDGSKFRFELPGPGDRYEADRGTPLMIYERDTGGQWQLAGKDAKDSEPTSSGADTPPSPQGEGLREVMQPEAGTEIAKVDFKALDKLIDYGSAKELGKIEARIDAAKRQTMGALLEIGRCLNEAKDRNLVPHGSFEAWAAEQTGINERTRQRMMQAAREIPAGSAMERLDFTKAITILALPDADREGMAEKADAEDMTLRKLQKEVGALTKRANLAEDRAKREQDWRMDESKRNREKVEELLKKVRDGEDAKLQLHKAQQQLDAQAQATKQALDMVRDLERTIEDGGQPEHGISKDAQYMLDKHAELIASLRQDKADAERYAEEQAALRQDAQQELLRIKTGAAHGQAAGPDGLTGEALAEAVRGFLGTAGVLPHMGKLLSQLPNAEREIYERYVTIIGGWTEGARRALDMVAGEGAVSGEA